MYETQDASCNIVPSFGSNLPCAFPEDLGTGQYVPVTVTLPVPLLSQKILSADGLFEYRPLSCGATCVSTLLKKGI